jgi:hypothetical protein
MVANNFEPVSISLFYIRANPQNPHNPRFNELERDSASDLQRSQLELLRTRISRI